MIRFYKPAGKIFHRNRYVFKIVYSKYDRIIIHIKFRPTVFYGFMLLIFINMKGFESEVKRKIYCSKCGKWMPLIEEFDNVTLCSECC